MTRIFEIDDLRELAAYLLESPDTEKVRASLFAELLGYVRYRNADEWNRAVRLCEALAIVGWGDREPLEAIRDCWVNGNPETFFVNRRGEPRFRSAVWSKRKEGLAIDPGLSSFYASPDVALPESDPSSEEAADAMRERKLCSQRNWIPKNPICIARGLANCYDNSRAVIESMESDLSAALNLRMRPERYGPAINRIVLNCSFSFYDNAHCKTNYVIADEALKLRQKDFYPALLGMFSEQEIADNGYYLRNRFSYGPFRSDTGTVRVGIVFEKEFGEQSPRRQKEVLGEYFVHAVRQVEKRLRGKVDYDFGTMIADLSAILKEWCEMPL